MGNTHDWAVALVLAALSVLVLDGAAKYVVRQWCFRGIPLGPLGGIHAVPGRLWMHRRSPGGPSAGWLWLGCAAALIVGSALLPHSGVFAGLMLGGSLSNMIESSRRGAVTDYVCPHRWPAFNLADVALTVGAIGVGVTLMAAGMATV